MDKERIENAPKLMRTRAHIRACGGTTVARKALRMGLANVLKRDANRLFAVGFTGILSKFRKAQPLTNVASNRLSASQQG